MYEMNADKHKVSRWVPGTTHAVDVTIVTYNYSVPIAYSIFNIRYIYNNYHH